MAGRLAAATLILRRSAGGAASTGNGAGNGQDYAISGAPFSIRRYRYRRSDMS